MKNINNNHGFTLVELLAVIVVLAIVMLVAVQSVLPQMEKARRQTLALDAQTAIESANTYFMNLSLSSGKGFPSAEGKSNCVTIKTLVDNGYFSVKGNYDGKVVVTKQGSNYVFKVWLLKDQLEIIGAGASSDGKTNEQIKAYDDNGNEKDVKAKTDSNWTGSDPVGNTCGATESL